MPSGIIAKMSIQERKAWLRQQNSDYAAAVIETAGEREAYIKAHATVHYWPKCMDGRVKGPELTGAPIEVLVPFRNIGGKFEMGWDYFAHDLMRKIQNSNGRKACVWVTYHFSSGDNAHRGCAGFGCDMENDISFKFKLRDEINAIYENKQQVYPFVVGIDTDTKTLRFHASPESFLDTNTLVDSGAEKLRQQLIEFFPDMPEDIAKDIVPLIQGNMKVRDAQRENPVIEDLVHNESVIAFGKGFRWFRKVNVAVKPGVYDPHLDIPLRTALHIIEKNLQEGRLSKEGFVLLLSDVYTNQTEANQAVIAVKYLKRFAMDVIRTHYPHLEPLCHPMLVVVDDVTMKMTEFDESAANFSAIQKAVAVST